MRFKNLSNQQLVNTINKRYKNGQNDDDHLAELVRRRDKQGFTVVPGYDTYTIVENKPTKKCSVCRSKFTPTDKNAATRQCCGKCIKHLTK
tara:strand:+ start:187 stop:459 length:273 start_codon:yes stop_codon:yes gene_type:complete